LLNPRIKKLTTLALLAAMSCMLMVYIPGIPLVPAVPNIKFDFTDTIIVMSGFMFGPLAAFTVAAITGFVNMVTVSSSGIYGMLMYVTSSAAFAVPAAVIYKYRRTLPGAVMGLAAGVIIVVPVMLFWNYIIMPLYLPRVTREMIAGLLLTAILPANAIKYSLSMVITLIVYRPVVTALKAAGLYRPAQDGAKGKINLAVILTALAVLLALAAIIILLRIRGAS
jgi:riboflavin transporter FmnP